MDSYFSAVMDKTRKFFNPLAIWNILTIICASLTVKSEKLDDVYKERQELLQKELNLMLGSDIVLSDSEILVNDIIMDFKKKELDEGFNNPQLFNVSKHFFEYKDAVKMTELYKLIQGMPKGAVLHVHDMSMLGPDYLIGITYINDLYVCFEELEVNFLFAKDLPNVTCPTQWQLMRDARFSSGNVAKFDKVLRKHFTLVVEDPNNHYPNKDAVWSKFKQYFMRITPLLTFKPVWEQYFYDALKAFREDNVMFLEFRSVLPDLYDLEGITYNAITTAEIYKEVLNRFVGDYPDFIGAKLIYAPFGLVDNKTLLKNVGIAKEIKKRIPEFFAGFDLIDQKNTGVPKNFLSQLFGASGELDFFFHAGQTNWYGTSSDENLIDAIVLNSKRIGHGFALNKYPVLLDLVKKNGIAIEVNVISNSVLKLVNDVRNHPLAAYMAHNLPVVVSSDDPGVWEADPLSHDFYVVFVGVASRHADLRLLKKLALNSLYYSTYPNKDKLVFEFEFRWAKFIDSVVKSKFNAN